MVQTNDPARSRKFRQAAVAYLHVALLYEMTAYVLVREGLLPTRFGPPVMWLILGALLGGSIVLALYFWQNVWFARIIWMVHGLRLRALIGGAFFPGNDAMAPPGFYITALVVVVLNLWMLARAAWDV